MNNDNEPLAISGMRKPLLSVPGNVSGCRLDQGRGLKDNEGRPVRSVSSNRQRQDVSMKMEDMLETVQRMNRLEMPRGHGRGD